MNKLINKLRLVYIKIPVIPYVFKILYPDREFSFNPTHCSSYPGAAPFVRSFLSIHPLMLLYGLSEELRYVNNAFGELSFCFIKEISCFSIFSET